MGLAPLRGCWGRGRDPTPEVGNWGTIGRAEDQKAAWPGFPYLLGPLGTAEIPGPDPLLTEAPSSHEGPEGVGGREGGAKVKARPPGPAPLRGSRGEGRSSYIQRDTPTVRGPVATGEMVGGGGT